MPKDLAKPGNALHGLAVGYPFDLTVAHLPFPDLLVVAIVPGKSLPLDPPVYDVIWVAGGLILVCRGISRHQINRRGNAE
jgi:hypothetical protein